VEDLARQIYAGYYGNEALGCSGAGMTFASRCATRLTSAAGCPTSDRVRIRTAGGFEVPLLSVADVTFTPGYSTITRTDGMRRVAVSAGVDTSKANANEIFAELSANYFPQLKKRHPGLFVDLQGEQKKMRESFGSLFIGFPLAVLGIFIIIATMFRSYAQPFVIMFTVPFGIIGAVFGHLLLGYDLSIMSIFGMVALTGVVVNDAIVLIERINENFACGMPFFDAILKRGCPALQGDFPDHAEHGGGIGAVDSGNRFPGQVSHPHGAVHRRRRRLCHGSDPDC
jgi:hypothetical protein